MRLLLILTATCTLAQPFRPQIPKVWDEEALRTMELPLATPEASPRHISAERYYAIPELPIYKSYPQRDPGGKSDAEYLTWLREQEPVIVDADPRKLTTKQDWIRAGEAVFEASTVFREKPVGPDQRIVIRTKGKIEYAVSICGSCHNRAMSYGSSVAGAQLNLPPVWKQLQPVTPEQFTKLANTRAASLSAPWLNPDPNTLPGDVATFNRLRTRTPNLGPRFHSSMWAPSAMPSLIGVKDLRYLDRTGHVQHRDIGDLMRYAAVNFGGGFVGIATTSFGPAHTESPISPTLGRLSDNHLFALALYVYSLEPPPNPHLFDAVAARGQKIFAKEGCATCHTPPLYTNNKLTPAPGFRVPDEHKKKYAIMPVSVGTDPWLATKTKRGTGYYKVPSLRGVWYRGPFEHNGSVLTLEDWLDPARLRDDYVPTGWLGPNETRAVKGHEFGLKLKPDERKALIAFLKTL